MGSKRHGCTCEKCRECCTREAGWFMPDEVPYAASYLKLSEKEFVKKYCEEHIEDDVCVISPKSKPRSTECIFLDSKGLCKIHPAKPYECRKVFGCESDERHRRVRENIKKRWRLY